MNYYFLEALKASLQSEKVEWNKENRSEIQLADLQALFQLAEKHKVLPMICEAVCDTPAVGGMEPEILAALKKRAVQQVILQSMKTNEFLALNRYLRKEGLHPLVVKGIVCREQYPNADYRQSGDEDILISENEFEQCHRAMLSYGMLPVNQEGDASVAHEISYRKPGTPLYIEMHKFLFSPESQAYGDWNRFFEQVHECPEVLYVQDTAVLTLNYTDHLLYLICHAFKHCIHSGFGIRQVCDIVLFANTYGSRIDWQRVLAGCREIRAEKFAAALFLIGEKYLVFDRAFASYPEEWARIAVDETLLLEDLLAGGIYGDSDMSRKHSSGMTLHAVTAQKKGGRVGGSILRTLFPPAKYLENRYPCLKKHPCLLPFVWIDRVLKYGKETRGNEQNRAAESIKVGNRRISLLKSYDIIEK